MKWQEMHGISCRFFLGFIKTTALLAAMWDTKSNIEKMEKNEKSC